MNLFKSLFGNINLTKKQLISILKVAAYLGASAFIGGIIAWLDNNPQSFGIWTPIINLFLVTVKKMFEPDDKE